MKQNKVMSVFNGEQMQKYFLLLTKQAEEAAYKEMVKTTGVNIDLNEFLLEIKNMPQLKAMIQDMVLLSISNINWQQTLATVINNNHKLG